MMYRTGTKKSTKPEAPLSAQRKAEERAPLAEVKKIEAKKIEPKPEESKPVAEADTHRKLTSEDFMIAAGKGEAVDAPEPAPVEAEAKTEAKPEPKAHMPAPPKITARAEPVHAEAHKPQPPMQVFARANDLPVVRPAAPIVRQTPPRRVDGFGAEGAVLAPEPDEAPRTEIAAQPNPLPEKTADARDDAVIASLGKPTHEELAEEAAQPKVIGLYTTNGRLIVPPPLRGSHEVLVHQNTMADEEGLDRIYDDADLDRLRAHHLLVDFPESASLHLNPELPENRRCARIWSVKFAADMGRAFYERFHQPLQISSAVRTVQYQRRLERVNGNAAAVDGEGASPHLTGQAIDFGKSGMSVAEIAWMRAYLMPLMQAGKVDVEEEFKQACFHISVYKSYLPTTKKVALKTEVATLERQ